MSKQTAVEQFADNVLSYKSPTNLNGTYYILIPINKVEHLKEQAKAMEKEQHEETFNQGVQWMQYHRDLVNGGVEYWDKEPAYFLDYYNETFGGNK